MAMNHIKIDRQSGVVLVFCLRGGSVFLDTNLSKISGSLLSV